MIPFVLLVLFGASCLLLIGDGVARRGGIFEFSFLAGCGLFGILFVEAIGIVRNPDLAPEGGVIKALVMSTLCALSIYFGWKAPVRARRAAPRRFPFSLKWMYRCGIASAMVSLAGFIFLSRLSGGVAEHYSTHGAYTLKWEGLPVVYVFFMTYGFLGFTLLGLVALRLRSWLLLWPALIPFGIILADVVLMGRRSEFVFLALAGASALYFSRNIAPPRALALALAPLAMAAMFLFPAYRRYSQVGGDWKQIRQISVSGTMGEVFSGTEGEFWTMCYLMEIAGSQSLYQYGAGFYNEFVITFVPKLLVGEKFKANLLIDIPTARTAPNRFGWHIPYGMVPTGPYTLFEQFWYFGAALLYFLAKWLKGHWVRALAGDFWSQLVYSATVTFAVAAVVNDLYAIYLPLFMFIVPMAALAQLRGSMHAMAQPYRYDTPGRFWRLVPPAPPAANAAVNDTGPRESNL